MSNPEHVARMLAHQESLAALTSVPFAIAAPYVVVDGKPGSCDWFDVIGPDGVKVTGHEFSRGEAERIASDLNAAWRAGFLAVFDKSIPAAWKRDALKRDGEPEHVHESRPDVLCGCPYGREE